MLLYMLLVTVPLLALDRLTKLAFENAKQVVIPGVLGLHGVENHGAAFGLLASHPWILVVVSALVSVGIVAYLLKEKPRGLFALGLIFVLAGALGNLWDRVQLGYVIDFIELLFVRFAIFNVADICVTGGCLLAIVGLLLEKEPAHA